MSIRWAIGARPQVDNAIMLCSLAGERLVELGPTVRLELGVEIAEFKITWWPQFERDKMRGTGAHALADVIAGDYEVVALDAFAAHDDMDVRIVSVPVVDCDPIQLRAEIPLGLRHQVPGERLKVGELLCVLRRDDKTEMVAIAFTATSECAMVSVVMFGVEHPARGAVLRYAFSP